MSTIKFLHGEPPSVLSGAASSLEPILAQLRKHPKQWARIRDVSIASKAQVTWWRKRFGPAYEWRGTVAGAAKGRYDVYARYVGNGKP